MTAGIRSRRAGGISPEEARNRPLYARVLGLQYVRPSNLLCFLYFEGTVALAVLLSLAELTGWWAVAVLPASVAVMVKLNDVIAGATTRSGGPATRARGGATRPKTATRRALAQPTVRLRVAAPAEDTRPPRRADRPTGDEPFTNRPGHHEPAGPRNGSGDDVPDSYPARPASSEQDAYAGRTGYAGTDAYAGRTGYAGTDAYAGQAGGYGAPGSDVPSGFGTQGTYATGGYADQEPYTGQPGHGAPAQPTSAGPDPEEPWLSTAEQRARQSAAYRYE